MFRRVFYILSSVVAMGADPQPSLTVFLGERAVNQVVQQRVVLPLVGPVRVQDRSISPGMVWYTPEKAYFLEGEPVVLNVYVDLHGVERGVPLPPTTIQTSKGPVRLLFEASVTPFSVETPCRFGLTPSGGEVLFEFRACRQDSAIVFDKLTVLPADAPVEVRWVATPEDGAIRGGVCILANPSTESRDGKIHEGTLVATTKGGESDFIRFHWIIPRSNTP